MIHTKCICGADAGIICVQCMCDWVERAIELLKDLKDTDYKDLPYTKKIIEDLIEEVEGD